jgi:hypothetical protein
VEGGPNSISKFHHHNINGGAVSTIHDVTGRRLVSSSTHEISMTGMYTYISTGDILDLL